MGDILFLYYDMVIISGNFRSGNPISFRTVYASANSIYGLGVLPEYRRQGYGREILTQAIEKLKERNAKDIMLQVAVKNNHALNLYSSCGFEVTSRMDYYEVSKGQRDNLL